MKLFLTMLIGVAAAIVLWLAQPVAAAPAGGSLPVVTADGGHGVPVINVDRRGHGHGGHGWSGSHHGWSHHHGWSGWGHGGHDNHFFGFSFGLPYWGGYGYYGRPYGDRCYTVFDSYIGNYVVRCY